MTLQYPNERIDFIGNEELKIIQSPEVFSFSLDALFLANFAYLPIQKGKIIDLCTGNGVIPLLLSQRSKAKIIGVEIQERLYGMAQRSVALNGLDDQIELMLGNIKECPDVFKNVEFDVVTCNPPYFQTPADSEKNNNQHFAIARHEIFCTLEDVIKVSSRLVKQGGKAAFVHRPNRLLDIITLMRHYRLEPKRLQFIYPKAGKDANMILIEGIKDGKPDLKVLPPLTIYDEDNQYTEEVKQIIYG